MTRQGVHTFYRGLANRIRVKRAQLKPAEGEPVGLSLAVLPAL